MSDNIIYDMSYIEKLPTLSNAELAQLLRLNHRTPEYRDALLNEALARMLLPPTTIYTIPELQAPTPKPDYGTCIGTDPMWPKSKAAEDFNRRIDA